MYTLLVVRKILNLTRKHDAVGQASSVLAFASIKCLCSYIISTLRHCILPLSVGASCTV